MNIKLKLTQASTAIGETIETIVLPEDSLVFDISTDVYDIKTLVVTARNGKKEKQFKVIDFKPLDLTEFLIGGVLQLEISAILKGHVVKSWRVPDITASQDALNRANRTVKSITAEYSTGYSAVGNFYLRVYFEGGGSETYNITEKLKDFVLDVYMFEAGH